MRGLQHPCVRVYSIHEALKISLNFFEGLGIQLRSLYMLDQCSNTKSYSQHKVLLFTFCVKLFLGRYKQTSIHQYRKLTTDLSNDTT